MPFRFAIAFVFISSLSTIALAQSSLNPSWTNSSYLGGSGSDTISAQTGDTSGNIYVAGLTSSTNFPTTPGVYEPDFPGPSGSSAFFVSKFSSTGLLLWSTYLGPGCNQFSVPDGIAVDSSENVYLSGIYGCSGYPSTVNLGTSGEVFLTKLNSTGSKLVYSTTLGNNSILGTPRLVLDSSANAYVIGSGGSCCNGSTGIIGPLGGISDFWVAEINSAGTALSWSVEIGGTDDDLAYGLAIDSANELYLTGYTASSDFPTTAGALVQPGDGRAFIVKLDPTKPPASSMVYSALAGNPGNTSNQYLEGDAIAVGPSGDAYVAGWTYNGWLYTSPNAFQHGTPTAPNGYVFELNPSGSAIINGTYLGGGANDFVGGIVVDNSSNTYVFGSTYSWDFPTTAYGNLTQYNDVAVYVKLNPQFAAISSVEFGPAGTEAFHGTVDSSGGLWFSGYTVAGFPTTPNAYQPNFGGGSDDGYLVHTNYEGLCNTTTVEICTLAQSGSNSELIHFASQAANLEGAKSISLSLDGQQAYTLNAAQFDTLLPVAPGSHTATVTFRAVNATAETSQQTFTVKASATCPINPISPSLTICSPLNAAVLKGSVTFNIQANDPNPPKTVYLNVDGKAVATLSNQNGTYTYTMTLAAGWHTAKIHGTDLNHDTLASATVFQVSQ